MNAVGFKYSYGTGVAIDRARAMHWFCRAAVSGDPRGLNNRGIVYYEGAGVIETSRKRAACGARPPRARQSQRHGQPRQRPLLRRPSLPIDRPGRRRLDRAGGPKRTLRRAKGRAPARPQGSFAATCQYRSWKCGSRPRTCQRGKVRDCGVLVSQRPCPKGEAQGARNRGRLRQLALRGTAPGGAVMSLEEDLLAHRDRSGIGLASLACTKSWRASRARRRRGRRSADRCAAPSASPPSWRRSSSRPPASRAPRRPGRRRDRRSPGRAARARAARPLCWRPSGERRGGEFPARQGPLRGDEPHFPSSVSEVAAV